MFRFAQGLSQNRTLTVSDLNKAAFYQTYNAELISVIGKYPNNLFTFCVPGWLDLYERAGGYVPYNAFCVQRQELKKKTRKLAGLPEHFTGKKNYGFKLMDLAVISHWKNPPTN